MWCILVLLCFLSGGESRSVTAGLNTSFTYDLFVCIAILTSHKREVSKEMDAASVYGYLNRYNYYGH